jgi:hypothetical protein
MPQPLIFFLRGSQLRVDLNLRRQIELSLLNNMRTVKTLGIFGNEVNEFCINEMA